MKEKIRILLVDDEQDALEFLSFNLQKEGYEILTASDGLNAMRIAENNQPHLIVLDVSMPEMDGIEVCKELRLLPKTKNTLITFLTARTEEYSQIAGLDAGADDYILKPIKPRLLISRIQALLRRRIQPTDTNTLHTKPTIRINKESYSVTVGNTEYTLPRKEFEILELLASKPGKLFNRKQILSMVWGADSNVDDRAIDVHIKKLRDKIGEDKIITLKGLGYKFEI